MRIAVVRDRPDSEIGRGLITQLDREMAGRYPPSALHGLHPGDAADPRLIFLVAFLDGTPAGCSAVRPLEPGVGEVKRMFVLPAHRGRGISRADVRIPLFGEYVGGDFGVCYEKRLVPFDGNPPSLENRRTP